MLNLNLKNKILILLCIFFLGCATTKNTQKSFFMIKRELSGAVEIVATPDRILLECADTEEDPDEGGRYLFMIQMLDEENTVTTSMLGIRPNKEGCEIISKKAARILKKAKRVYIASRSGPLTKQTRVENRNLSYIFPIHGTFFDNGRVLQLGLITNDRGECYNPLVRDHEPCLEFPFPLEKHEKRLKLGD